jgi:hypothetical protein
MRQVLSGVLILSFLTGSAEAARLSLRGANVDDPAAITLEVSQTAILELVLELEEGEEVGSANMFLDTVQTEPGNNAEAEKVEFLGVTRVGEGASPWSGTRAFAVPPLDMLESENLPLGEGFSLDTVLDNSGGVVHNGYYLIANMASGESLAGAGTFVLDRITIHATTVGKTEVSFEIQPRRSALFDASMVEYKLAEAGDTEWAPRTMYLGPGDGRDGGEGPLTITVVEEAEPNGNDNTNGNENDNSGTNTGPRASGGGFCAWGMMGTLLFGLGALTAAKVGLRWKWVQGR